MPAKTVTLEFDAYEKLRSAKSRGESFTEVVRRAVIAEPPLTGTALRAYLQSDGSSVSAGYLDSAEQAAAHDPQPEDPWA